MAQVAQPVKLTHGRLQLRLGGDGLWYRFVRSGSEWVLDEPVRRSQASWSTSTPAPEDDLARHRRVLEPP